MKAPAAKRTRVGGTVNGALGPEELGGEGHPFRRPRRDVVGHVENADRAFERGDRRAHRVVDVHETEHAVARARETGRTRLAIRVA